MSDAQTIFLILIGFYFIECMKWAPLDACALTQRTWSRRDWQWDAPFIRFYGGKKSVFIAPWIPLLRVQWITDAVGERAHQNCPAYELKEVRASAKALLLGTLPLRIGSMCAFGIYFLLLPLIYQCVGEGSYLYSAVALGYLMQAYVAVCYYALHRRHYSEESGRRWLHTLYCLALPWHAMRASDEFFGTHYQKWSELTLLAAYAESVSARERLSFYWREAKLAKKSRYSLQTLRPVLAEVGLFEEDAMAVNRPDTGVAYCPCCAAHYEGPVTRCADCDEVDLLRA